MSEVKISELPPIAHHIHIIVLAAHIEMWHRNAVRQDLPPNAAREMAIHWTVKPENKTQEAMVRNAYTVAIRLNQAMEDLGLKWDKRRISMDHLVNLGL